MNILGQTKNEREIKLIRHKNLSWSPHKYLSQGTKIPQTLRAKITGITFLISDGEPCHGQRWGWLSPSLTASNWILSDRKWSSSPLSPPTHRHTNMYSVKALTSISSFKNRDKRSYSVYSFVLLDMIMIPREKTVLQLRRLTVSYVNYRIAVVSRSIPKFGFK